MLTRRSHKGGKQSLGERVANHTLGVPLDADDPVGVAGPLNALNRAVGGICRDTEVLPRPVDRLVMAAVDCALRGLVQLRQPTALAKDGPMLDVSLDSGGRQIRASVSARRGPLSANVLD